MSKPQKKASKSIARQVGANPSSQSDFDIIVQLIDDARTRAVAAVNTTLIELYWTIGEFISRKIESANWGEGVVDQLAAHISRTHPGLRGYTRPNLFRMRQFYETYKGEEKISPLVRQLPWSHNLLILGKSKRAEEREFYLRMATSEKWSKRELERQINGALFERVIMSPVKVAAPLRQLHPNAATIFKDSYLIEFLELPPGHSEADLHRGLVEQLKNFLIELGRDFCYVGSITQSKSVAEILNLTWCFSTERSIVWSRLNLRSSSSNRSTWGTPVLSGSSGPRHEKAT